MSDAESPGAAGSSTSDNPAASRPSKETNSVTGGNAGIGEDDYDQLVHERVIEFMHEYPHLADLPISKTHGRKLRRIVTEAEWHDVMVESDQPTESSFQVSELARRDAATWADALSAFLTAHTKYEGLLARFATADGDQFDVPLADAWGEEYSKKQYARALALQRQMAGGDRPTGGEAVAAWDSPATAMLTFTASSVPDGNRVPPVEHTDALHDSFSYNGVRDTLRNTMEYHLGLEADEWGYWLQAEPHGVGDAADSDASPGMNACYTHLHVGVYFEATDLDLEDVGPEFERVVDKHVAECEYATFDAHDYRNVDYLEDSHGCISLNADVGNMGSYLATYMGGYTEDLLDKPIEYLAWGAIYWSAARRRTSRSKIVTSAVKADACEQRAEHPESRQSLAHGEEVKWNDGNGLDVVCSCCGSGWSIDQTQLDEPISDEELTAALDEDTEDRVLSLNERWPSANEAASIGELPTRARIRSEIEEYLELHDPSPVLIPHLLGELMIDPVHAPIVREVVDGQQPEPESFRRPTSPDEWELVAIVDRDGEEHQPGGGGVDMVSLKLPIQQILDETRLQHDLRSGEVWRCSECNVATHNTVWMARHLVETHGLDRPVSADSVLHVEDYHDRNRECMKHPAERERQTGSVEFSDWW